jgi:glucose-6-phosphate 1-dehydrogenase
MLTQVKVPGNGMIGESMDLSLCQSATEQTMNPYERLLMHAVNGDQTLFAREDGIEAACKIADPVLHVSSGVELYAPGSWQPPFAALAGPAGGWHDPRSKEK